MATKPTDSRLNRRKGAVEMPSHASFGCAPVPVARLRALERHDDVEIDLVTGGAAVFEFAGDRIALPADRLTVFWAGRAHRLVEAEKGVELLQVTVPVAWVVAWGLPEALIGRLLRGLVLQQPVARPEDRAVLNQWRHGSAARLAEMQQANVHEVQARMLRLWGDRPGSVLREGEADAESAPHGREEASVRIDRALRHINTHFRGRLPVAEIARAAGVHPNHLGSLFKQHLGTAPADFVTLQRVRHAQRLLATSQRKMLDIAFECGFPSASRFYASFARFCGKAPGDYRRSLPRQVVLSGAPEIGAVAQPGPTGRRRATAAAGPGAHVLWVDDQPLNNIDECWRLAEQGVFTESYTRNRDALDALRLYPYALVISDLARNEGRETGWDLLRNVRESHPEVPFLFFTDRVTPALGARARRAGAQGIFDLTADLVAAVVRLLPAPAAPKARRKRR